MLRALFASSSSLFLLLLAYRILNATLIQTFHVPDEYWQSIEVAHRAVFGYGFLTWEWQSPAFLRSFVHPSIFAAVYQLLAWTSLDTVFPSLVALSPVLLQAVLAAVGDFCLFLFAVKYFGMNFARWYTLINLTNWFLLHNVARTLANSLETILFSMFLYYWPIFGVNSEESNRKTEKKMVSRRRVAVLIAGLCFLIRPTSAILWLFFGLTHLFEVKNKIKYLIESASIALAVLILGSIVDVCYYGDLVSPLVQFIRFNFLTDGASLYGSHPFYWYLIGGIPQLLGPYTFPFIIALLYENTRLLREKLAWLMLFSIITFSAISHKEGRFLMPLIPIFHIYVTRTFIIWWHPSSQHHPLNKYFGSGTSFTLALNTTAPPQFQVHAQDGPAVHHRNYHTRISESYPTPMVNQSVKTSCFSQFLSALVVILIVASVMIAVYTCSIHQRGTIDLLNWTRNRPEVERLLLLMPCHHTPGLAYVHRKSFRMFYLDCSPGLPPGLLDQADQFYAHPKLFLNDAYPEENAHAERNLRLSDESISNGELGPQLKQFERWKSAFIEHRIFYQNSGLSPFSSPTPPLPTHVAMYDVLLKNDEVSEWLKEHGYIQIEQFFHAHAASGRVGTHVVLFKKSEEA